MKIDLKKYGPIVSGKEVGEEIYLVIKNSLDKNDVVEVCLSNVISMATFCAKQIFGRLYVERGSEDFFNRIKLLDVNEDLKIIIKMGIQSAIEEQGNR